MSDRNLNALDGGVVTLPAATLDDFAAGLRGDVLFPGDGAYDDARTLWNAMIDRRPGMIARCRGAADVARSVRLAGSHGLLTSVRGGGHNVAGNAACDGGLMIDLSPMRSVRVDPERRRAQVDPGCLLADLDRETQAHGLATPGGIISTTGVAGLTLGGGFGWLSRKHGLTADNLLSADVVTADGELVTASATENADLFWALRGGGGNFGVVTSFEFRLHELGPEVLAGLVVRPFEDAEEIVALHREFVREAPDELTAWVLLRHAPPLPFLPEEVHGRMVAVTAFLYAGDPEEGERLVGPLREHGRPHGEHVGRVPYTAWQSTFDALNAPGARNYWKSHHLKDPSGEGLDGILRHAADMPTAHCEVFLAHLEGAVARVPAGETAYAHRDAPFVLNVHTRWEDPADDDRCIGWARDLFEAARPASTGAVYVNFLSEEGADRVRAAYPPEAWERLTRLKRRYDPENLFRLNQNIPPRPMAA